MSPGPPRLCGEVLSGAVQAKFFKRMERRDLFETTGVNILDSHAALQMFGMRREKSVALEEAKRLLFIPEAIAYLLTDKKFSGLTSLSALRLATELYKRYGISVNMDTFVKTATLQSIENDVLSTLMLPRGEAATEVKERSEGPRPLTYQQEGVYFDCMKAPHETVYNIPVMWTLPAGLDAAKVRDCVLAVLKCHPYINTHFEMIDGKVMQIPSDKEPEVELLSIDEAELESFKTAFTKPFNLSEGPLYRVAVVQVVCADGKTIGYRVGEACR